MKRWQANLGLLTCAIMWGGGFIATDIALETMTPFVMQTFRFGMAALILTILFYKKIFSIKKNTLIAGLLTAIAFGLAMSLQTYGLVTTTISKSAFFTVTNVAWVPVILFIFIKKRISPYIMAGVFLMLVGFFFLIFQIDIFNFSTSVANLNNQAHFVIGDLLTILSAILFAVHIILTGVYSRKHDAIQLLTVQMWGSAIFSFILVFIIDGGSFNTNAISILSCVFMAVFSSIIAYGLQITCQKYADTSQAAILLTTEAAFATIFSVMFGREAFFSGLLIGGIIIIFGVILAETELGFLKQKRK